MGAGITGLSAAHAVSSDFVLLEATDSVGGLTRSERHDGFTFDLCGHVLHGRPHEILANTSAGALRLTRHIRRASIYIDGKVIPYPFQSHFYDLEAEVVRDCAIGLIRARTSSLNADSSATHHRGESFEDWIIRQFGQGIARHFMLPYNMKLLDRASK